MTETIKLQTKYFGEIEYADKDVVRFPDGLFGFEEEQAFLLLPFDGSGGGGNRAQKQGQGAEQGKESFFHGISLHLADSSYCSTPGRVLQGPADWTGEEKSDIIGMVDLSPPKTGYQNDKGER